MPSNNHGNKEEESERTPEPDEDEKEISYDAIPKIQHYSEILE